jgi:hypothetical protein
MRDYRFIQGLSVALRKARVAANAFDREQTVHLAVDVAEFNRRLASDEFAGRVSNLSVARTSKPKK